MRCGFMADMKLYMMCGLWTDEKGQINRDDITARCGKCPNLGRCIYEMVTDNMEGKNVLDAVVLQTYSLAGSTIKVHLSKMDTTKELIESTANETIKITKFLNNQGFPRTALLSIAKLILEGEVKMGLMFLGSRTKMPGLPEAPEDLYR